MEIDEIRELFEKHDEEFLKFERVENKLSNKRDLHAFILINQLMNGNFGQDGCIIGGAEHDEIYLGVEFDEIELTENIIIDLHRCGIIFDEELESFKMLV